MNITATITGSAGDPIPSPMATFSIDLKDLDYEEVYGDFKTQTVTADEDFHSHQAVWQVEGCRADFL